MSVSRMPSPGRRADLTGRQPTSGRNLTHRQKTSGPTELTPRQEEQPTDRRHVAVVPARRREFGARQRILVVGAGPAGVAAAEELRRSGFVGRLTMLCEEGPYDRPACSKAILTGHQVPRDTVRRVDAPDLDWQTGRRAAALDLRRREVVAHTGEAFPFDGLVIATGTRAVLPDGWPHGAPGLHTLHTLDDAWGVRRDLRRARRVAVVGGGLTGCEVASAVRHLAREAVLIDSRGTVMHRAVGEAIGALVTEEHRRAGVDLRLGRRVRAVARSRGRWRLSLDDGDEVVADVVVVTAGERPECEWLAGSGLDVGDGVLCDPCLRVVGAPGVVAAGVVARWPNLRSSPQPGRVGQWIAALEHGRAAARTLIHGDRPLPPVTLLPRFWSQQHDLRIQVCGEIDAAAEVTVTHLRPGRRRQARSGAVAGYHRDGQLIGVAAVNAPHAFTASCRALLHGPDLAPVGPAPALRRVVPTVPPPPDPRTRVVAFPPPPARSVGSAAARPARVAAAPVAMPPVVAPPITLPPLPPVDPFAQPLPSAAFGPPPAMPPLPDALVDVMTGTGRHRLPVAGLRAAAAEYERRRRSR